MGQWLGNMLQVDLKLSTYLSPQRDIQTFNTCTWPLMTKLWPPLGTWIRSNYFQLRESVELHVDFDLVGAIGDFCSIPLQVKRWQACALEVRMFDPAAPQQAHTRRKQVEIEDGIRARLASARWIAIWMQQHDLPANSLLRTTFDVWNEPDFTFEPASLDRLAEAAVAGAVAGGASAQQTARRRSGRAQPSRTWGCGRATAMIKSRAAILVLGGECLGRRAWLSLI
jgi:hypothetical protein